jgi:ribonuclease D
MGSRSPSPPPETILIQDQSALDALSAHVRGAGRFAFDTEFVMEDRYATEVCLIQVATTERLALVDPLTPLRLDGLWDLIADPRIDTIVHAGQEDLALCVQHAGRMPARVFDVQLAAGLVGNDYPMSLQKLARAALGVHLHKSRTLTDWRRRPLSEEQCAYAVEDVRHLLPLCDRLTPHLRKLGRLDWLREECARFEQPELYRREDGSETPRIKGSGSLDHRSLHVAREILRWRDEAAQTLNRPARTVLRDHLVIEIARHGIERPDAISDLRGLNLSRRHIQQLAEAVRQAKKSTPPEAAAAEMGPNVETPEESMLVHLLTAVARCLCQEQHLAFPLVATKRTLIQLVRLHTAGASSRTDADMLRGWRKEAVGDQLQAVLLGKSHLTVKGIHRKPHIVLSDSPSHRASKDRSAGS